MCIVLTVALPNFSMWYSQMGNVLHQNLSQRQTGCRQYVITCTIVRHWFNIITGKIGWVEKKTGQHRSDTRSIARERRVTATYGKHDSTEKRMSWGMVCPPQLCTSHETYAKLRNVWSENSNFRAIFRDRSDDSYSPFFLSWHLTPRCSLKTERDYGKNFWKRLLVPKKHTFV